jgi:hypothetical protein
MDIHTLHQASKSSTFRPFTLVLSNGDTIKIEHPEHLHVVPGEIDVVVLVPGGGWRVIDSRAIREIQIPKSAA